ncbi:helix-turn-helix domain-containing protein [Streptomyces sp. NPDC002990]
MTQSVESTSATASAAASASASVAEARTRLPSPKERRRLREGAGLTHEDVAAAVGVTPATIRSWESGRTRPRGRKREAYARILAGLAPAPLRDTRAEPDTAPEEPDCPVVPADSGVPSAAEPDAAAEEPDRTAPAKEPVRASAEPGVASVAEPPVESPSRHESAASDEAGHVAPQAPQAPQEPGPGADTPAATAAAPEPVASPEADGSAAPPDPAADAADAEPTAEPADAADPADEEPAAAAPQRSAAAMAFDALYGHAAPTLVRQAYLLTGRRDLSEEAVERAFQQAWARWPEVAGDPDPVGWVRAAAYEYALSPWHLFRRVHRHPDKAPAEPADRILLDAMLALPAIHRRTVLLYDGVGLDLPDTAAETEATTPTAGGRLLRARAAMADRIPELDDVPPEKQSAVLRERFAALEPAVPLEPRPAAAVRLGAEKGIRVWTRAALGLTAVITVATAYTATTAPTQYAPPYAPGASVSGVPPLSGPQQLTDESRELQDMLRTAPGAGPARVTPRIE